MKKEEKIELIQDKLSEISWGDDKIEEIMDGIFDNPSDAVGDKLDDATEEHLDSLIETLEIEV